MIIIKIALTRLSNQKYSFFNSQITNVSINHSRSKVIEINNSKLKTEYTYANVNLLAHWLNFKKKKSD